MPPAILHLLAQSAGLPDPFLPIAAWLMEQATAFLAWGDAQVGGSHWVPTGPWLFALTLLGGAWWLRRRAYLGMAVLAALLIPEPRLAALDVGQGDSIFLRTKQGQRVLVDAGPPGFRGRDPRVLRAAARMGMGGLDALLLTHPDQDHRGGMEAILQSRPAGSLWLRGESVEAKAVLGLRESAERAGVAVRLLSPNSAPPGMHCWLAPVRNSNDGSPLCVAELPRGESIWLTGDMSERTEEWLMEHAVDLPPADYLKVAHHGSRTSSSPDFLRASGAKVALISVGARNRYGHPTQDTLRRLAEAGMTVRRTDREGSVVIY